MPGSVLLSQGGEPKPKCRRHFAVRRTPGHGWPGRGWSNPLGHAKDGKQCSSDTLMSLHQNKAPDAHQHRGLKLMPGSVLLSHGETPHYHRR